MSAIYGWARFENVQPEPITLEIWRNLPEDYCRQVEVVDGKAISCESPTREHQTAARRLANMLEAAARAHKRRHAGDCLDVNVDFDLVLWRLPRATIRRPDVALFECAPPDERPVTAQRMKLVVEIVSPGNEKTDTVDKKAEYAAAGIPWYWLVWIDDYQVTSIEIHVLDHTLGQYRPHVVLDSKKGESILDVPIRIKIDWDELLELMP